MNVKGLCAFGAADGAKIRRLIKIAEREGVVVVAVQETWFKKQRNEDEMVQAVAGLGWRWFGARRKWQKRKDRKGSGGVGFLVHDSAGRVKVHSGSVNGVMWLELEAGGETTHVVNLYLVPTDSPRTQHNDDAIRELERVMASTEGERRIVLGDWNARIGELSSFVFTGAEEERGDDVVLEEREYTRKSTDKKANQAGKQIVDIMNAQGLVVLNGLDAEMQSSQRGSIGWSVVDCVATSPNVMRAGMDPRAIEGSDVKIFSDHVMVTTSNVLRRCELAAGDFDADVDADFDAATKDKTEKQRWQRKKGAAGRMQWEQVREMGEVEMEDFVKEWCEQVQEMQHVDIDSTWTRYKMRAVKVQEAKIGRKRVRLRKCQGEWYEVSDLELHETRGQTRAGDAEAAAAGRRERVGAVRAVP